MSDKKMSTKDKIIYKAVIIGAGRIAAGFDNPSDRRILTHSHAYKSHSRVSLEGIFDIDKNKAKAAAQKWGSRHFSNLKEMLEIIRPDIVSVCTPDDDHFSTLKKLVGYKPKLIICEKPLTRNIKESKYLVNLFNKNNIPVLVNFSRRFDQTTEKIKKELDNGKFGKVIGASAIYTKGIVHNGSHMVDLARHLFGEVKKVRSLHSFGTVAPDKAVGAFLELQRCPQLYLMPADSNSYTIFELDILCEKIRIRFVDEGFKMEIQSVENDPVFAGYKILGKIKKEKTFLDRSLYEMVDNAINYLDKREKLLSDISNAFNTQIICESILKKYV